MDVNLCKLNPPRLHISWMSFASSTASSTDATDFNPSSTSRHEEICGLGTDSCFIVISCSLEGKVGATWRWCSSKKMDGHSILLRLFLCITIFPPEETRKVSVFWQYSNLIKHRFYAAHECNRLSTESAENASQIIHEVGSLQEMAVEGLSLILHWAVETTLISLGSFWWYTPWWGMYQMDLRSMAVTLFWHLFQHNHCLWPCSWTPRSVGDMFRWIQVVSWGSWVGSKPLYGCLVTGDFCPSWVVAPCNDRLEGWCRA